MPQNLCIPAVINWTTWSGFLAGEKLSGKFLTTTRMALISKSRVSSERQIRGDASMPWVIPHPEFPSCGIRLPNPRKILRRAASSNV
jgi:hypothetical protein